MNDDNENNHPNDNDVDDPMSVDWDEENHYPETDIVGYVEKKTYCSQEEKTTTFADFNREIFGVLTEAEKKQIEKEFNQKITFNLDEKKKILKSFLTQYFVESEKSEHFTEKWNIIKYFSVFSKSKPACRLSGLAITTEIDTFFENKPLESNTVISNKGAIKRFYPWIFKGDVANINDIKEGCLEDIQLVRKWHYSVLSVTLAHLEDFATGVYKEYAAAGAKIVQSKKKKFAEENGALPLNQTTNRSETVSSEKLSEIGTNVKDTKIIIQALYKHLVAPPTEEAETEEQEIINSSFILNPDDLHGDCNVRIAAFEQNFQHEQWQKESLEKTLAAKDDEIKKLKEENKKLKTEITQLKANTNRRRS